MEMDGYTLPREAFELLEEAFGDRGKAETFARAMEAAITAIDVRATELITARKEQLKVELRNELITRELFGQGIGRLEREIGLTREMFEQGIGRLEREIGLTREMFDERFKVIDERFNSLNFKLNIFIAIALLALTLANPTFVALIERLFRSLP